MQPVQQRIIKQRSSIHCYLLGWIHLPILLEVRVSINLVKSQLNLTFQIGGMLNLTPSSNIDCVISQQTLTWLREYQEPLEQVFTRIKPSFLQFAHFFTRAKFQQKISPPKMSKEERYSIIPTQFLKLKDLRVALAMKFFSTILL